MVMVAGEITLPFADRLRDSMQKDISIASYLKVKLGSSKACESYPYLRMNEDQSQALIVCPAYDFNRIDSTLATTF